MFDPLLPESRNIYRIAKLSFQRRRDKRNSYESLVYESVDIKSLSYAISQNWTKKNTQGTNGLILQSSH